MLCILSRATDVQLTSSQILEVQTCRACGWWEGKLKYSDRGVDCDNSTRERHKAIFEQGSKVISRADQIVEDVGE
jgi:hypothetical protein